MFQPPGVVGINHSPPHCRTAACLGEHCQRYSQSCLWPLHKPHQDQEVRTGKNEMNIEYVGIVPVCANHDYQTSASRSVMLCAGTVLKRWQKKSPGVFFCLPRLHTLKLLGRMRRRGLRWTGPRSLGQSQRWTVELLCSLKKLVANHTIFEPQIWLLNVAEGFSCCRDGSSRTLPLLFTLVGFALQATMINLFFGHAVVRLANEC